jgi:hypothetical protein
MTKQTNLTKSVIFQIRDYNHYFEKVSLKHSDRMNEFVARTARKKIAVIICL